MFSIGHDADVQDKCRDGVYWVQLGEAATDASVVAEISRTVDDCGGSDASQRSDEHSDKLCGAVDSAQEWFRGRRVILPEREEAPKSGNILFHFATWFPTHQDITPSIATDIGLVLAYILAYHY